MDSPEENPINPPRKVFLVKGLVVKEGVNEFPKRTRQKGGGRGGEKRFVTLGDRIYLKLTFPDFTSHSTRLNFKIPTPSDLRAPKKGGCEGGWKPCYGRLNAGPLIAGGTVRLLSKAASYGGRRF